MCQAPRCFLGNRVGYSPGTLCSESLTGLEPQVIRYHRIKTHSRRNKLKSDHSVGGKKGHPTDYEMTRVVRTRSTTGLQVSDAPTLSLSLPGCHQHPRESSAAWASASWERLCILEDSGMLFNTSIAEHRNWRREQRTVTVQKVTLIHASPKATRRPLCAAGASHTEAGLAWQ